MLRGIYNNTIVPIRSMSIHNPLKWSCIGYSYGGRATSFYIPEINVMIDAGIKIHTYLNVKNFIVPKHLLITHDHSDHSRYTDWYIEHNDDMSILLPYKYENFNENIYKIYDDMYHQLTLSCRTSIHLLTHRIPSYGYGITYNDENQVLFMGDTNIDVLYQSSFWKDYPVIFIECTNYRYDKKLIKKYHNWGHISWLDILPFIKKNKDIFFVLTHSGISMNTYQSIHMNKIIKEEYKLNNVYLWVDV